MTQTPQKNGQIKSTQFKYKNTIIIIFLKGISIASLNIILSIIEIKLSEKTNAAALIIVKKGKRKSIKKKTKNNFIKKERQTHKLCRKDMFFRKTKNLILKI